MADHKKSEKPVSRVSVPSAPAMNMSTSGR